ncbi:hypothetical protein SDC9_98094 [bioreactor metagenome]|uniref:N-acetyltransferase domain-containing protein n=1 Tax=bioreactor metagenome TaxID=1076179 RepID=A0A645AEG5_9ZZZZ
MEEPELKVSEIILLPTTEIPKAVLDTIDNSFVFSIDELNHAKSRKKTMYISSNKKGEFIGYCITSVGFPFEVAEELDCDIEGKVVWIDVLEIAVLHQGYDYGRAFVEQIKSRCSYDILLLSIEDSICFWQQMNFKVICYSGEMAYMIYERQI